MNTADFAVFVDELGTAPTRIRVSAPHWRDILMEIAACQRYAAPLPFVGPPGMTVRTSRFELSFDASLEPGAFEFDL